MTKQNLYTLKCNERSADVSQNSLLSGGFNVLAKRPFVNRNGETCIMNKDGSHQVVTNVQSALPYEAWLEIDRVVVQVATERLVVVQDLIDRGLTHQMGSVGQTVSLWDRASDMTDAEANMSGNTSGEKDNVNFDTAQVAIPVIHKDFEIHWREREASMLTGESLDTSNVSRATRKVSEKSEDAVIAGLSNISVNGAQVYGYTNFPDRNTVTQATPWDAVADNQDIIDDVIAMMDASRAQNFYGPFTLYIPLAYEGVMDEDFQVGTGDTRTVRQRIMQIDGIERIVTVDRMPANNVVLVQLTADVVDLATAQGITPLQWSNNGGMVEQYKVMAVWAPRCKSDYDGKCGITVLAP